MINTALCTNDKIVIDELTDDEIKAHCTNCGQNARAKRVHYSKKAWAQMVHDAKGHMNGVYDK